MKLSLPVLAAVLAAGLPLSVLAQAGGPQNGPPPEVRAQMQAAHDAAKTAAFNDKMNSFVKTVGWCFLCVSMIALNSC